MCVKGEEKDELGRGGDSRHSRSWFGILAVDIVMKRSEDTIVQCVIMF